LVQARFFSWEHESPPENALRMKVREAVLVNLILSATESQATVRRKGHAIDTTHTILRKLAQRFPTFGVIQTHHAIPPAGKYILPIRRIGNPIQSIRTARIIRAGTIGGYQLARLDISFVNQALSAEYMVKNADKLEKKVYSVPTDIDKEIARLKLEAMGIKIDILTDEQLKYLSSWEEGT
jgi:hypothetical protein